MRPPAIREPRESSDWPLSILVALAMLFAGALLDCVIAPGLCLGWTRFRFLTAAVALQGLHRGRWRGVWTGWTAGLLLAALSTEYIGLAMLRLGVAGWIAGCFRKIPALGAPWLELLAVLGIVFSETLFGSLAAATFLGGAPDFNPAGALLTIALLLPVLPLLRALPGVALPRKPARGTIL